MMPKLRFDSETHTYTLDGRVIPSVTQILSAEGLINSHTSNPYYMTRGRHAHDTVRLYLEGNLDEESLDPQLNSYLQGAKDFLADTGFKVQGFETPMYHPYYLYAGTPDLWGLLENRTTLIDVKTGSPDKWHVLQLSAYYRLLKDTGQEIKEGANLYLNKDGKYSLKTFTVRELMSGLSVFLSALTLYNFKKGG